MFSSLLKYRCIIPVVMIFLTFGCAGMQEQLEKFKQKMNQMGQINLPDPIAVSLDKMPEDAALVTIAIHINPAIIYTTISHKQSLDV